MRMVLTYMLDVKQQLNTINDNINQVISYDEIDSKVNYTPTPTPGYTKYIGGI